MAKKGVIMEDRIRAVLENWDLDCSEEPELKDELATEIANTLSTPQYTIKKSCGVDAKEYNVLNHGLGQYLAFEGTITECNLWIELKEKGHEL